MNVPRPERYPEDFTFSDMKKELVGWDAEFRRIVKIEEDKALMKLKKLTTKLMKYGTAIEFNEDDVEEARIMLERIKS